MLLEGIWDSRDFRVFGDGFAKESLEALFGTSLPGVWGSSQGGRDEEGWRLPGDVTLDLLLAPDSAASFFAPSLLFWREAAAFALDLARRGHFIPGIVPFRSQDYRACWLPFYDWDDSEALLALANSMPPPYARGSVGPFLPLELTHSFVSHILDLFIKRSLARGLPRVLVPRERPYRSVSEQWMAGLLTHDAFAYVPSSRGDKSSQAYWRWFSTASGRSAWPHFQGSGLRTCFKLEPEESQAGTAPVDCHIGYSADRVGPFSASGLDVGGIPWRLSYSLQSREDPGVRLTVDEFWRGQGKGFSINPAHWHRFLGDLYLASKEFSPLAASLERGDDPSVGVRLDAAEAYQLLRDVVPTLRTYDFGILVPPWWTRPSSRPRARLRLSADDMGDPGQGRGPGSGLLRLKHLVRYDWEVALGDETVSLDEFLELARLKVPLVKVRGQWVELPPEEIEKAIEFFEKKGQGQIPFAQALRASQSGLPKNGLLDNGVSPWPPSPLPVQSVEPVGRLREVFEELTGGIPRLPLCEQPESFQGKLRPYQVKGFSWLGYLSDLGLGACLADDMGLGKTIEFLAFLLHKEPGGPSLMVCPMSVVGNWEREANRFAPTLKVMVYHGAARPGEPEFLQAVQAQDLVITTYGMIQKDLSVLSKVPWKCVALDEAQNIKNPQTARAKAARSLGAESRIALTGTPVENRLSEMWSIMEFLNPGYLGSLPDFRERFALPIERRKDPAQTEALQKLVRPLILRRLKTDPAIIQDLPDKMEMKVFCNLTKEQASLYQAQVDDMLEKIGRSSGIQRRGLVLSALTRLKQICNHPAHFQKDGSGVDGRSGKLNRLLEMLEEVMASGEKALVFTQYAEMGHILDKHLRKTLGRDVLYMDGSTPKTRRDLMVNKFQEEEGPGVFVLSLKAGGLGLNLTAANHVFHFDRWWNPAVENQATDRAFRIGQSKNVLVHKLISVGTLEERIDRLIEEKKYLAESVIQSGEAWITEMTTDELRDLLTLGEDAVRGEC